MDWLYAQYMTIKSKRFSVFILAAYRSVAAVHISTKNLLISSVKNFRHAGVQVMLESLKLALSGEQRQSEILPPPINLSFGRECLS